MPSREEVDKRSEWPRLTRLQQKFLKSGLESLEEQEVLQFRLSLDLSPRNSKKRAKDC